MSALCRCTIGIRNPAAARVAAGSLFLEQWIVHRAAPVPAMVTIVGTVTGGPYQKLIANGE
jgi:hypothetical protein